MTEPILFLSASALFYALIRKNKAGTLILSFAFLYFLVIGLDKNTYARFMLPLVAILCVLCGSFLYECKKILQKRYRNAKVLFWSVIFLLLLGPVYKSVKLDTDFLLPNTMTLAKNWAEMNIPSGSSILLNDYGPALVKSPVQVRADFLDKPQEQLRYPYYKKRKVFYDLKERAAAESINYDLHYIPSPVGYLEGNCAYEKAVVSSQEDLKDYEKKFDFIFISGAALDKIINSPAELIPSRYLFLRKFYEEIRGGRPIKIFSPKDGSSRGPSIKVYKGAR